MLHLKKQQLCEHNLLIIQMLLPLRVFWVYITARAAQKNHKIKKSVLIKCCSAADCSPDVLIKLVFQLLKM